jgi:hypothetical protein
MEQMYYMPGLYPWVKCEMLVKIASYKQWKQEEIVCFLE